MTNNGEQITVLIMGGASNKEAHLTLAGLRMAAMGQQDEAQCVTAGRRISACRGREDDRFVRGAFPVRKRIREIAEKRMRCRHQRIQMLLRREGWRVHINTCTG